MTTIFLGIDVSKDDVHFYYTLNQKDQYKNIVNSWDILTDWVASLTEMEGVEFHAIVEFTGTYSTKIIYVLRQAGLKVSVITPNQSKSFAKMKNYTTKNDKSDARLLAQYGQFNATDLPLYELLSEQQNNIKQLLSAISQVEKMLQQSENQAHAYSQIPIFLQQASIIQLHQSTQAHCKEQLILLQKNLEEQSGQQAGDLLEQKKKILTIVGIGKKTATAILAKTNGLKEFDSSKKLAKFFGIAPTEKQSGTSVRGKSSINRNGCGLVRSLLFNATRSARTHNKACKELYLRLRKNGKPYKKAVIAVCNLLIRQIFAVVKSGINFDNDFAEKAKKNLESAEKNLAA